MAGTLGLYVSRLFAGWLLAVFAALSAIVYLLDSIELIRRTQRLDAPLLLLLKLSALKLPHLLMELFPFAVLFAAMLCFWRLARSHELTVIRAAGVSVWQFLLPVLLLALVVGVLRVGALNPLAAALYARHEVLESEIFRGRASSIAQAQNGFGCARPARRATPSSMRCASPPTAWSCSTSSSGASPARGRTASRATASSAASTREPPGSSRAPGC